MPLNVRRIRNFKHGRHLPPALTGLTGVLTLTGGSLPVLLLQDVLRRRRHHLPVELSDLLCQETKKKEKLLG